MKLIEFPESEPAKQVAQRFSELGLWFLCPQKQIAFQWKHHVLVVVDKPDGPYTCTMAPGTSMEVFRAMIE